MILNQLIFCKTHIVGILRDSDFEDVLCIIETEGA